MTVLVENYAPVHLVLHALEWQFFEAEVFGYHVVNVLLHALAALLLVPVFRRSGAGAAPATRQPPQAAMSTQMPTKFPLLPPRTRRCTAPRCSPCKQRLLVV